jgi:hypothetical protein
VSVDPRQDVARAATADPVARLEQTVAELRRQLEAFRNRPVQVGSGAPTADPATLPEGSEYIDRTAARKYYVVAGAWRYSALT